MTEGNTIIQLLQVSLERGMKMDKAIKIHKETKKLNPKSIVVHSFLLQVEVTLKWKILNFQRLSERGGKIF